MRLASTIRKSLMKIVRFFEDTNLNGGGFLTAVLINSRLDFQRFEGVLRAHKTAGDCTYLILYLAHLSLKQLDPNLQK